MKIPNYLKLVADNRVEVGHQAKQAFNLLLDPSEAEALERMLAATRARDIGAMNAILHEVLTRFEREMDKMIDDYERLLAKEACAEASASMSPQPLCSGEGQPAAIPHKNTPEA